VDRDEMESAAGSLRRLVAAVEAGDLDASSAQVAALAGAVAALEALLGQDAVRDTDV
jgi:hypothetical protein